jgi:pimeloyl-ACP methyl ester carboxylesterase
MLTIDVNDVRVACQASGQGQPVVMLHSSASSSGQWRTLRQRLQGRFRTLAVDLHGYGGTGQWQDSRPMTLADEAELVGAVMAQASRPVHLVGHSLGGAVALRAALTWPRRIASLTLIEPVSFHLLRDRGQPERQLFAEVKKVAGTIRRAVERGDRQTAMACFVEYWNGLGTWARLSETKRAGLTACAEKILVDFRTTMEEPTTLMECRRLTCPTLVLRGALSPAPTWWIAELLAQTLRSAELTTVEGAGHMLPVTHGSVVNELIAAHIAGDDEVVERKTRLRHAFPWMRTALSTTANRFHHSQGM